MQINNNTKIKIKVLIDMAARVLGLLPLFRRHLEIKSLVLESSSKLESVWVSLENRD